MIILPKFYNYCTREGNVLDKEIARGSNGTIIFEGSYGARKVAVKRLVRTEALVERLIQADFDVGSEEYNVHVEADGFNNIVRCYGRECEKSFVYLFLELCTCSLDDLIRVCSPSFPQNDCPESGKGRLMSVKCILGDDVTLWKEKGYPSPLLLKLMRDVVCGLMNLHENKIVHLNLTTRNILITGTTALCAKLSDMARSKKFRGDNSSTSHLLRLMRNYYNHYQELPREIQVCNIKLVSECIKRD
ncbi:hypothetical protein UlMin_003904 [Ulmus minor]